VPGILMSQRAGPRHAAVGARRKVNRRFFLVGLSNVESERTRNLQL